MTTIGSLQSAVFRKRIATVVNQTIATGATAYAPFAGRHLDATPGDITDEDSVMVPVTEACTLKNARLLVMAGLIATTTVTVNLRKRTAAGVYSTLASITYADTDAEGTLKSFTGEYTLAAGDSVHLQYSHDNGANRSVHFGASADLQASAAA